MNRIFCIIGKTGSGKDTLFKRLLSDRELRVRPVVTCTTRPMRRGEKDGADYYFVTEAKLDEYRKTGRLIESREYDTIRGKWYYATVDAGIKLCESSYMAIETLESYTSLRKYYGSESVVPIYLEIEDGLRLTRLVDREMRQKRPDYDELCRRFLADNDDFSETRLEEAGIYKKFQNFDLCTCLNEVKSCILNYTDSQENNI